VVNSFVSKASSKISKLSDEQILGIIDTQTSELKSRNLVLDNAFIGYVLVDKEGTIVYINKAATSLVPVYKKRKYNNCAIEKVFMEKDIVQFMRKCIKENKLDCTATFDFDNPSMERKVISFHARKIDDFDGLFFIISDVTFFYKFKDEFRKNESLASMTTMAAGVAHEIKNPLASILLYVQIMEKLIERDGCLTKEEAEKNLSVVKEEVQRLNSIAVDFLFAVKPMKVSFEKYSLNDLVNKVLKLATTELEQSGIQLNLNLASSMPNVMMDIGLMQQVLLNLIKNAIQAMNNCENGKNITIDTYLDGTNAVLAVSDTGCGMTEKQMEKIFEPYFTTKSEGNGLGLTIVFKIIKEHGGDIHVRSTLGEGSQFTITLPIPQEERFRIQYNSQPPEEK
jgi:two-component system, sporulation sensor kinase E